VDDAASYASRFSAWVSALRAALGRDDDPSSLPVMVVGVTAASTAKLTHLRSLREQIFTLPQVTIDSLPTSTVENVIYNETLWEMV
jgi:hypothetical protein